MAKRGCPCGVCESWNQPEICASCANLRLIEKYKLLKRLSQRREALHLRVNFLFVAKVFVGTSLVSSVLPYFAFMTFLLT
ncbi:hypothetical protein O6H91_07G029800 [Diphasiastrum complanatum]|uniref:Uncharacterized protein n=1 Tax=Diphasiastrum complanatum TaxID=34168 RepID=A0ACC2D3P0_DIPCM|nr:hypothetical protein O6H91_07G029800 [Diphasiastrum complanatum]